MESENSALGLAVFGGEEYNLTILSMVNPPNGKSTAEYCKIKTALPPGKNLSATKSLSNTVGTRSAAHTQLYRICSPSIIKLFTEHELQDEKNSLLH